MKGRSSRKIQQEFPQLKKSYWGNHFWGVGYGAWSTGSITDEMVEIFKRKSLYIWTFIRKLKY